MALTFGAATSDRVDIGSAASLDDLATITVWAWVYITAVTAARYICGKTTLNLNIEATAQLRMRHVRATTSTIYTTNDGRIVANSWLFVAAAMNNLSGCNIWVGDLAAIATECSYGTATNGAGALTTDAASNFQWGNAGQAAPTSALQGDIAWGGVINRVLTLGEIQSLQRRPRWVSGTVALHRFGYNGVGTQPDLSGNGNAGTVTGATLAAREVPLRRWRVGYSGTPYRTPGTVFAVSLSGGVTPSGGLVRLAAKLATGGVPPAGTLLRSTGKILAGPLTPIGGLANRAAKLLGGALTPAGAITNRATKLASGGLAPAGALARRATTLLSGTMAPTGAIVRATTKALAGALTPAGAIATLKVVLVSFTGSIVPAGAILRRTTKLLTAAVAPAGALARQLAALKGGTLAPAGALVRALTKSLPGTLTPTGATTKRPEKVVTGAATPVGTVARQVAKLVGGVLVPVGAIVRRMTAILGGVLTAAGELISIRIPLVAPAIGAIFKLAKTTGRRFTLVASASRRLLLKLAGRRFTSDD